MAQLERTRRSSESPKTPRAQTSPTFEQLLRRDDEHWSSSTSPTFGMNRDDEEEYIISPTRNKKSVLTKVKERAQKLRHSLSGKKKHWSGPQTDGSMSPRSQAGTFDDDNDDDDGNEIDDDPEYLGAPMYESEAAPENLKETARQHPRAVPVVSEKHVLTNVVKSEAAKEHNKPIGPITAKEDDKPVSPNKTISETVTEKLAPAYAKVSDATHTIASKIAGLTVTTPEAKETDAAKINASSHAGNNNSTVIKKPGENFSYSNQSAASSSPGKWDKGVSVKEYFMNKLEPGEDEKALSYAITEAISPRKSAGDTGVVEKVKDAVTSLFWPEEPSDSVAKPFYSMSKPSDSMANPFNSTAKPLSSSFAIPVSSNIPSVKLKNHIPSNNSYSWKASKSAAASSSPLFTNSHEVVEEENHGRILQAN